MPWTIERHDRDDGSISYEIWDYNPSNYERVCTINDCYDNARAKKHADYIVSLHNTDEIGRKIYEAYNITHDAKKAAKRYQKVSERVPLEASLPLKQVKCGHCKFWSERMAQSVGGRPLEALCLSEQSPHSLKYQPSSGKCDFGEEGPPIDLNY
jgi:hypothetical protein